MPTIRKRGRRWQAQVRRKGQRPISKTFDLKSDAERWARDTERLADRGTLGSASATATSKTVGELLSAYAEIVLARKKPDVTERFMIQAMLREPFSAVLASQATPALFAAYRDRRLGEVQGSTVRRDLGLLQHAFAIARSEWGWLLYDNPLKAVRRPAGGKPRDRRLTPEERGTLTATLETCRNQVMPPIVLFAMETGMRLGELLSLYWQDVDLQARLAHLHETKNGWPRTVPLSPQAVGILTALKRPSQASQDAPVFDTTASAVKQSWKRLVRRAGLKDLHFHDLRHEAISRLFERGLNVPQVALISGHRDVRQLQRYTHLRAEDVVEKLRDSGTEWDQRA